MAKQKTHKTPAIETVNIGAAAVDVGSREHMAVVNPDVTDAPVRAFGTFTHDLHDLAEWFKSHGVAGVAMEFTGGYWIPAYEILEQHGFAVTIGRSDTALGAFYGRLAARAGKATGRKIAVLFYNTLRHGMTYQDLGASHYEERFRNRVLGNPKRRAKSFGYDLQELPPGADMAVS